MSLRRLRKWLFGSEVTTRSAKRRTRPGLRLEHLEDRSTPATFSVVNTLNSGAGSLRQAILDANASAGPDVIQFNIAPTDAGHVYYKNDGVAGKLTPANVMVTSASNDSTIADIDPDWTHSWYRIKPTSALPTITGPVTIDGYTQAGASANTSALGGNEVLRIELDGTSAGTTSNGLVISAGASTVRGMAINRFMLDGVQLQTSGGNVIEGNHIGNDVSGSLANHNRRYGVQIMGGSSGNVIGTDGDGVNDLGERNVLSANVTANVYITGAGTDNNAVAGNFIGTNAAGTAGFSSLATATSYGNGVWIDAGAQNNRIGTDANGIGDLAERNIISKNAGYSYSNSTLDIRSSGVLITGASTTQNVVAGNFIGTDVTGSLPLANGSSFGSLIMGGGITLKDTRDNRIGTNADGSGDAAERNVVSANNRGMRLVNSSNILIAGNYIGTDASGTIDRGNGWGVYFVASSNNTIGGTILAARNIISGNTAGGVVIPDAASTNNVVQGNFIGTDFTGTAAIGNGEAGVLIEEGQHNLIGGTAPGARNVISGNLRGIEVGRQGLGAVEGSNVIEGNYIGTDVSGTAAVPNSYHGILILQSHHNRIGGSAPGAGNVISGNGAFSGLEIRGRTDNVMSAIGNIVQGNWIGLDATGNGVLGNRGGLTVTWSRNTLIGGTTSGAGNLISGNDAGGISIARSFDTIVEGNVIGQTIDGSPAGNLLDGVHVGASWNTLIGGDEPGAGNIIANNAREYGPSPNPASRGPGGVRVETDVNPVLWWRAEQSALNAVSNGGHGTLHGGVAFAPGKYGYAFQFDGVDDYVEIPDSNSDAGSRWGIEAWVRPNSVDHLQQMISKFGPGGNAYQIGLTANGALQAQFVVSGVLHTLQSAPAALSAGEWAHVGFAYDALVKKYSLYLNGVEVDTRSGLGLISSSNTTPLSFGRKADGTEHFDGLIDEAAIHGASNDTAFPSTMIDLRYLTGGVNKWYGTAIRGNNIFDNGDLGIDLAPNGPNPTDPGDLDVGPNDKQNVPEILSATSDGTQVTIQGVLHSIPFTTYALDFFANSEPPPPLAEIEGEQYIGFGTVVTDATGTANFEFTFDEAVPVDYLMSTTATAMGDPDSDPDTPFISIATSEFSGPKLVTPKTGGRIQGVKFNDANANGQLDSGEHGLHSWTIYLDANNNGVLDTGERRAITGLINGAYAFTNLQAGTYYVREVQQTGWTQTTPEVVEVVVTNPQSNPTYVVNIGNHKVESLVSGLKFHDLDGDGIRDSGEPGLANFSIYIDENANGERDSGESATASDANGVWGFENLPAGTYQIREVQKSGWVQTTADPLTVTLTADGQSADAGAFGNYQLATISGAKFNDRNANGVHEQNEPGLPGWTIYLDTNDNGQLDDGELSDTTSFFGAYSFSGLTAGTYIVREIQQPGWEQTTTDTIVEVLPNVSSQEYTVLVGNFRPSSIIGGVKFHDRNGNGTRDVGEEGLQHWTITLDSDGDDVVDRITGTDSNGEYSFSGLPAGTYRIREVQKPGWEQATDDPPDIVIDEGGQVITGPSFGNYHLATISGIKFNDRDADGVRDASEPGLHGWTIFLDVNDNGVLDDGELSDTTSFGAYSFSGLPEGTYTVREVQQPGWEQTTTDVVVEVLPNESAQAYTVNVGNYRPSSIVGGVKFHDRNGNGVRDVGEEGLANWTIWLDNDNDGSADRITVTGSDGEYSFTNLPTGTYRIREVQETGWRQTTLDPADIVISEGGQTIAGPAFGNYRLATISGVKFEDRNANGILDAGEHGLANWTIYLDGNDNGALDNGETQTTTNLFGSYSFGGLEAGTYYVREVQQSGWTQTTPAVVEVTVTPNVSAQAYRVDVGNFRNGTVGGFKFHDLDRDGVRDSGEPGLEHWTIYLDANDNNQLDNGERYSITGADGAYSFGDVGPGMHRVREVQQVNWVQTTDDLDVTLMTSGESITGDIGNFRLARIQGVKFEDTNANGIRELGEIGLENWTIYLDANNNGALEDGEARTVTNVAGAYAFDGLEAGAYYVREIQQDGWTQTTPVFVEVTVVPNVSAQVYTVNVGNFRNGSMEGIKFHDINGNGVQDAGELGLEGWTIFLDGDGDNAPDAGERSTLSGANGVYRFNNLGPGTYNIREVQQPHWVQTTPDFSVDLSTSGQNVDGGKIGNFRLARITGVKFEDTDADGVRDLGEVGLENWTIFIDANDNGALDDVETRTLTNEAGAYLFDHLEAGTYPVREVQQPGWTATSPNPVVVTVVPNLSAQWYIANFGNFRNGSIDNGLKFHDLNRNGVQDQNEPGLQDWTIFLDADGDNMLDAGERSTVTDTNGHYSFTNLGPGTYRIREVQQSGWTQSTPDVDLDLTMSGQSLAGAKIGNYHLARIEGLKFYDQDGDGVRDAGEVGLEGWTIFLDANANGSLEAGETYAVTNSTGAYAFDNLDAGTYRVREVQQPGWVQTTVDTLTVVAANVSGQVHIVEIGNVEEAPGKITGGGSIDERIRNFGFVVQTKMQTGIPNFTGSLEYHDKALGINLHSTSIDYIGIRPDKVHGRFTGTAAINGVSGYRFEVRVEDRAEPGARIDIFRITITGPGGFTYDSNDYASMGGLLDRGGNIQIHSHGGNTGATAGLPAPPMAALSNPGELSVHGTTGNDVIEVRAGATNGSIQVVVNGSTVGTYTGVSKLHLYGSDGDDVVRVNSNVGAISTVIYGGNGNDKLYGGVGNNVLVGGDGDDLLVGSTGRDILIGGFGQDVLQADQQSDVLMGGDYLYADNLNALDALMASWASSKTYEQRVQDLQSGAIGSFALDDSTVIDDFATDSLTGAQQTDWFLAFSGDTTDQKANEIVS